MIKKLDITDRKAYQREDYEDRAWQYKQWLHTIPRKGYCMDADNIHWRSNKDDIEPFLYTELTRTDREELPSLNYLKAIEDRYFNRDYQAKTVMKLSTILNCPAYIVLFPPSVNWVYVFSFNKKEWKLFNPSSLWIDYMNELSLKTLGLNFRNGS